MRAYLHWCLRGPVRNVPLQRKTIKPALAFSFFLVLLIFNIHNTRYILF